MLLIGNPSISMGHSFHGYVKKPEGSYNWLHLVISILQIILILRSNENTYLGMQLRLHMRTTVVINPQKLK